MTTHHDSHTDTAGLDTASFQRIPTNYWTTEVEGSRWFKADLHIHTLDDLPGRRVKIPAGIKSDTRSDDWMDTYARRVLQDAIKRNIQVLGLTPHSPILERSLDTSVTWKIVDQWNQGIDDDGNPFCDKIYAVFPGFEPSLNSGSSGLHLIFLFDPEIGRRDYLKLFNLIMAGTEPWQSNELHMSSKSPAEAFRDVRQFHEQESQKRGNYSGWNYLILAPHIENKKGLLGAHKSQVLSAFKPDMIAGFELGDNKIPTDVTRNRSWLEDTMKAHRQAFFHSSDAYSTEKIGQRYTWVKLARPRIEALRQAFIAADSRLRIAFEKSDSGVMCPINDPTDIESTKRPWLRKVTIRGMQSFFRQDHSEEHTETTFPLNPDLTCIIGGSMTGKSAFLDGLRVHTHAVLPDDESIRKQVETRGRNCFASGFTQVELDCPGQHPSKHARQRWPAEFFTQNELQRLSQDQIAIQGILKRLVSRETQTIDELQSDLHAKDIELNDLAVQLDKLDRDVADAVQAYDRAKRAKELLEKYEEAGFTGFHQVGKTLQFWKKANEDAHSVQSSIENSLQLAQWIDIAKARALIEDLPISQSMKENVSNLYTHWDRIVAQIESNKQQLSEWIQDADHIIEELDRSKIERQNAMEQTLIDRGVSGLLPDIREFGRRAALLPVCLSTLQDVKDKWTEANEAFTSLLASREELIQKHRDSFDRVAQEIENVFGGGIRVRRFDHGVQENFNAFLTELRQRGITRWWNSLAVNERPSPHELVRHLDGDSLDSVYMTGPVQDTFRECLTKSKKRKLLALRCSDRYLLELRLDDGQYRSIHDLSGGQRVGLLLSLLLRTTDHRPLVIDQPEDELDNRFLFDIILPALKNLKGRRQVIVATHNANIVVNGDADLVIELQATANRGWIASAGTIDNPLVRNAIVRTVDGGVEAFQLRQKKYGF